MQKGMTKGTLILIVLVTGWWAPPLTVSRAAADEPPFRYTGGTMWLPQNCKGKLEINSEAMVFACQDDSFSIPYKSVVLMQYGSNLSRKVRKMKLRWKVKPEFVDPLFGGKKRRYFTVVYKDDGATGALVLQVAPAAMRPYLAEIDLKVGQRVEVERFDNEN